MGCLPLTDPLRSSPASAFPVPSAQMIPARLASTHSPLSEDEYSTASPLSTPTPTQPFTGDFMRREISETEYDERAPLRDSKIFDALMAALQKARTVVNFEWKPAKRQGKFEPAP